MATAAYEAVAETRPRIRRDVLFTETPDGVLFHNAEGGFQLNAKSAYRFATLIVPHLNGQHLVSEISEGFGERQRAMLGELIRTLYARGFARDVPEPDGAPGDEGFPSPDAARRFAPQIAYIDHYTDAAERAFQRFRQTRVAVLGEDEVARWCVLSLIRNGSATIGVLPGLERADIDAEAAEATSDGCPVAIGALQSGGGGGDGSGHGGWAELGSFDIVLVTGGPQAAQRLFPLLRDGIPEGLVVIPAWSYGEHAIMGPLMAHGRRGCWSCAMLRLGSGTSTAAAADVWSGIALTGASPTGGRPDRPQAAMIGNMLGYEVFRFTTGALRAETDGQLIVQDMASLDVTSEPLLPHPRCTLCTQAHTDRGAQTAAGAVTDTTTVDLATAQAEAELTPSMPSVATARDADALVEELNRRSLHVREHAGLFKRFADEALTQIPLKAGIVELGLGHGRLRRIVAFDVHHVAGARMRALNTAAEVYAEHVVPSDVLRAGGRRLEEARETTSAVAPGSLTTASGTGTTAEETTAWMAGTSLITKERLLVPAAAVRTFTADNAGRSFEATSAGTGAGPTLADAAARGLLSALAHDALMRTVRGAAAHPVELEPQAAPAEAADAEITFLVRSLDQLGLEWDLLDLGESGRSGVHVLLARAADGEWAVGGETSRRAAARAALRDLLGRIQLSRDESEQREERAEPGEPLLRDLAPETLAVTDEPAPAGSWDPPATWTDVLERLRDAGRDAVVVPTDSADLATVGIRTVRVLLTRGTADGA